jgi:hypothetical protein
VARTETRGAQAAADHFGGRHPLGGGQVALQWRPERGRDGDFVSPHAAAETLGFLPGSVRNPPGPVARFGERDRSAVQVTSFGWKTGRSSKSPASAGETGRPPRSLASARETGRGFRSPASAGRDGACPQVASFGWKRQSGRRGSEQAKPRDFGHWNGLGAVASVAARLWLSCTLSDFGRKARQATSVAGTREQRRGRDPHREVKAPQRGALEEPERMGRKATTQGLKPERRLPPDKPET